jgi:SiaC family regulatory phosphoprotein
MALKEVRIAPTKTTPEITLNPNGIISIKGRAIDESRDKFPDQMTNWIDTYVLNPEDQTRVIIALEFLNSFNTLLLTGALKKITQVVKKGKLLDISWHYEEDDVDIFERGEYISSTINIPINFIKTENLSEI